MIGMWLIVWIEMSVCVRKIIRAVTILVNVETIKRRNIGWCIERQMEKFCIENYTFIWSIIKSDDSGNVGVGYVSVYQGVCIGRCIHHISTNDKGIRKFIHKDSQKCFIYYMLEDRYC